MFPIIPLSPSCNKCACMNIPKVDYTRLDTGLLFCHLWMTAVYEAKWLASSTKKAGASLAQPFLPIFTYRLEGSDCHFEEA